VKKLTLPLLAIAVIVILVVFFRSGGTDMKQYAAMVDPRVVNLAPQKMLTIEMKGDPSLTSRDAFSQLFKTYYMLRFGKRNFAPAAPRARWTGDPKDRQSWTGVFGLPIPESVTNLPSGSDPRVKIVTWVYGDSAEILHKGAYTNEKPAIEKLQAYIKAQGFRVIGEHEEEYLNPPSSDSSRLLTIIRYRVEKTVK